MLFNLRSAVLAAGLVASASMPASAGLIVATSGGGTGINAVSAACSGAINGPALTIVGCLNSDHTIGVRYDSNENIEFAAGGQAKVVPEDDQGFNFLKIT